MPRQKKIKMPRQKKVNQIKTINPLNRIFKITIQHISNEYKLQCSIINNSNNEETKIKIQDKEEYSLQFTLDGNNIDFMNDLINNTKIFNNSFSKLFNFFNTIKTF